MKQMVVKWSVLFLAISLFSVSCSKEDDASGNEEELITTLRLTMREIGGSAIKVFEFKDPDGAGGNAPTKFDPIILNTGKSYTCDIEVLNESVSPAEDITVEIYTEADDHQFYFEPSGVNIVVNNQNTDSNGLPLGASSTFTAGAVGNGTLKVTLKHKPEAKMAGDPVSKGETDIEVNFTAQVQ